jgi:NAD dependent epimerase/dehydratase family enzyme
MSWIHLDDLAALIEFALATPALNGPVNAVAPHPTTNAEFTRELAAMLHRPAIFPVPAVALRLLFGEMSQVLLGGQRVIPQAALRVGFHFRYDNLAAALRQILGR